MWWRWETIGDLSRDRYSLHLLFLPRLLAHLVVKFVLIFNTFFIFVRGYAHFCCILEHAKLFFPPRANAANEFQRVHDFQSALCVFNCNRFGSTTGWPWVICYTCCAP